MGRRLLAVSVASLVLLGGVAYGVATSAALMPPDREGNNARCHGKHKTCTPSPTPTTSLAPRPTPMTTSSTPTPSPTTAPSPSGHKVMVIIEENHSRAEAMASMPQ